MSSVLLVVPFAAVFVAIASITACAVALLARLVPPAHLRRIPETLLWAASTLAPLVLGALGCAALASPNPFMECHCALHGLHHPHICLSHPGYARPLLAPAALLLGAWALVVAPRALRLVVDVIASERWIHALRRSPASLLDGVEIRLADCATRSAVTVGTFAPVIVFDRALWDRLSEEDRRAVVHHEHAHAERRDGITLLTLCLCAALFPVPAGLRAVERWRDAAEIACDAYAARRLGDAAAVAAALVAVERARALPRCSASARHNAAFGVVAGGDLERRVMALLSTKASADRGSSLGNDALAVTIVALGSITISLIWPGSEVHHAVETIIGLLVH